MAEAAVAKVQVVDGGGDAPTQDHPIKAPIPEKEKNKEDEETALDGKFIKVERGAFDAMDGSHAVETITPEAEKPPVTHPSLNNSSASREVLGAQEKASELELELDRVAATLKDSESQNAELEHQLSLRKSLLEENGNKVGDLELSHQKLQQQNADAEERYRAQLKALADAVQSQEAKHQELIEVKEALNSLNLEFDISKKKMEVLEQELQTSVDEARKFEELHKQSGSHAESETKRALEFERLLELAKLSTKEMEDQTMSLKEELKGLYEKIAENKVEAALKDTTAELSTVRGELELSRSQLQDVEQRLTSKEALLQEFSQELDTIKASESQLKEDVSAMENLHSSTKEQLQLKVSDFEDIKLKLEEEVIAKEVLEANLKSQEEKVSLLQEEVAKTTKDKEALEATVADLTSNAAHMEELSEALANTVELEEKLKKLDALHQESGAAADTANQKNLEFEEIVRASNAAADEAKSKVREFETRCIAAEQRSVELGHLLNLVELKKNDAERDLSESSQKISELNAAIEKAGEEKELLNAQIREYQVKVAELESHLGQSTARHTELELDLKNVTDKCAEHEGNASKMHQRSLELEDLMQASHSKAEEAGKRVIELELMSEAEKYRIRELEEQIATSDKKSEDAEAESKNYLQKVSELQAELEAYKSKASSWEIALETATEKEKELNECIAVLTEVKKSLEEASKSSTGKLAESEALIQVLQNETSVAREKLESLENDLLDAGVKETEFVEKLKSAEEQLGHHGKLLEQATTRSIELESLHETLKRDSELELQEALGNFSSKDLEAKSLYEKLNLLEDQVKSYEEQLAESARKSAAVHEELEHILLKLTASENANEELLRKTSQAENKSAQFFTVNELLAETNAQLKAKVLDLEELLKSSSSEKEAAALQLASHVNTITELTEQHSRASELQLATESRIAEAEKQLEEAVQRFALRDSEARDLIGKSNDLETQLKAYEEQAQESSTIAESRKVELEQIHVKLKSLESVVEELESKVHQSQQEGEKLLETNIKLAEELATYESRASDLETKLATVLAEKDETAEQLHSSKQTIEGLTKLLNSEGERLQSQISSIIEEKNVLTETHEVSKKELQALVTCLEKQLKEHGSSEGILKGEIETLKDEIHQKSKLQNRLKGLEEKLAAYEQKEILSQKQLEELEAKNKRVQVLENQMKELEQKLQLADAKPKAKDDGGINVESRDIGSSISSPSKRKSKKRTEGESSARTTSEAPFTHSVESTEVSPIATLKFILGVALVSVIIGLILGKRYGGNMVFSF